MDTTTLKFSDAELRTGDGLTAQIPAVEIEHEAKSTGPAALFFLAQRILMRLCMGVDTRRHWTDQPIEVVENGSTVYRFIGRETITHTGAIDARIDVIRN